MTFPYAQQVGTLHNRTKALQPHDFTIEFPPVSIVVLNWNAWEVTSECLKSLKQLDYPNYKIVVVDNGSSDCSVDCLAVRFPDVPLLRNEQNLGFAAGNNVGIRYALEDGAKYVLLLNNDTTASPSFLTRMVSLAESDRRIGILNPKIYYFDPPDRIWYAGGQFSPWRGFARHIGQRARDRVRYGATREVSFVTGCAFLIKAEVIARIGLLDERFFMVCEDTDWSIRSLEAGFKAIYVADAVIFHRESYTIKYRVGKWIRDYHNMRSSLLLARKHAKCYHWPSFLIFLGTTVAIRTAGYFILGQFDRIRALYGGLWDGATTDHGSQVVNNTVGMGGTHATSSDVKSHF
jgi:GT2 family glycosyltransferase